MATRKRKRDIVPIIEEAILRMAMTGLGGTEIYRRLERDPDLNKNTIPEVRTVQRVVEDVNGRRTPLDQPFQWHIWEASHDLPWEASGYVLDMWAFVKEEEMWASDVKSDRVLPSEGIEYPSIREVRWWWRIHLVDPDLDLFRVWSLTQLFVARGLLEDLLHIPQDMADLVALLAYKPWQDDKRQVYLNAIRERRIPRVKHLTGEEGYQLLEELFPEVRHRYIATIVTATQHDPIIPKEED